MTNQIVDSTKVQFEASSGKLWVYNSRLCNIINKIVKEYDDGTYYFQMYEEAVFHIPSDRIQAVATAVERFK